MEMRNIFLTAFVVMGALGMKGQLTAEIDVERTVVPRLELQAPLPSMVPSVIAPTHEPMRLSMSEYSGGAADFTVNPGGVLGPAFTGLSTRSPYRGYVWGGYFPAYNLGIGAGFRPIDTDRTTLGAAMQFDGSSYHAHVSDGSRPSVKDNTVGVQADFSHIFSKAARLGAMIGYSHAVLTSPTMQTSEQDQKIDNVNAALQLDGQHRHAGYAVKVGFGRFSLGDDIVWGDNAIAPPSETTFGLSAVFGGTTPDSVFRYSLAAAIDMKHRSGHVWTGALFEPVAKENPVMVSLDPTVGFRFGNVGIDLGARVDLSSGLTGSSVHVAPLVDLSWAPSGRFAVFARSDGGARMTDLRTIYNYSAFAPGVMSYDATFSPVNARAGFAFGPFEGFSAEIYARYASTRRAPMMAVIGGDRPLAVLAPVNMKGWGAGISLGWNISRVSVSGTAEMLQHDIDRGFADVPDRAGIVAALSAQYKATDRISADASWNFSGNRSYALDGVLMPMRNISNLNLGVQCRATDRLDVFLRFENILGRHTEILPGLTSNGIHGLAGIVYRL